MQIWGITNRGCVREENQDSYDIVTLGPDSGIAVVCDGMGSKGGQHCQRDGGGAVYFRFS